MCDVRITWRGQTWRTVSGGFDVGGLATLDLVAVNRQLPMICLTTRCTDAAVLYTAIYCCCCCHQRLKTPLCKTMQPHSCCCRRCTRLYWRHSTCVIGYRLHHCLCQLSTTKRHILWYGAVCIRDKHIFRQ